MKIWRCNSCHAGVRAPERLAFRDVRRWCLQCSARTGQLVERSIPGKAIKREKAIARTKELVAARREQARAMREAAKHTTRGQLEAFVVRSFKLEAFGFRAPRSIVYRIRMSRRYRHSTGHAWYHQQRLVVTAGSDPADARATIIHELAHLAVDERAHHGDKWRGVFADAIHELTGRTPSGMSHQDLHRDAVRCVTEWMTPDTSAPIVGARAAMFIIDDPEGDQHGES